MSDKDFVCAACGRVWSGETLWSCGGKIYCSKACASSEHPEAFGAEARWHAALRRWIEEGA